MSSSTCRSKKRLLPCAQTTETNTCPSLDNDAVMELKDDPDIGSETGTGFGTEEYEPHSTKKSKDGRQYVIRKHTKRKAKYWEDFNEYRDEHGLVRIECKFCQSTFAAHSTKNGTKNLKKHWENCQKNPANKKGTQTHLHLEPILYDEGGQTKDARLKYKEINVEELREG